MRVCGASCEDCKPDFRHQIPIMSGISFDEKERTAPKLLDVSNPADARLLVVDSVPEKPLPAPTKKSVRGCFCACSEQETRDPRAALYSAPYSAGGRDAPARARHSSKVLLAVVTGIQGDNVFIHYPSWGLKWDEWLS